MTLQEAQKKVDDWIKQYGVRYFNEMTNMKAAPPAQAEEHYELFKTEMAEAIGKPIQCGEFGADMKVRLINDGPVTIIMDSKNKE